MMSFARHALWLTRLAGPLGVVMLLVACAPLQPAAPWYRGVFLSPVFGGMGFKVACDDGNVCEVDSIRQGSGPKSTSRLAAGNVRSFPTAIPNNNLKDTQRYIASHANWDQLPGEDGMLLKAGRAIVASEAVFSECIDLDVQKSSGYLLCARDGDPSAQRDAYLLVPSMAPTCGASGTRPFCAYLYVPLNRMR